MGWKCAVFLAIEEEGNGVANVARRIRRKHGSSGWDGRGMGDKEYASILQKVTRTYNEGKQKKFDAYAIEKSYPLVRKQTSGKREPPVH